jgi:hypothetical protein
MKLASDCTYKIPCHECQGGAFPLKRTSPPWTLSAINLSIEVKASVNTYGKWPKCLGPFLCLSLYRKRRSESRPEKDYSLPGWKNK